MIRSTRWMVVAALLPVAACSSNSSQPVSAAPAAPALAAVDTTFLNTVAGGDAGQIQMGQLAVSKAHGRAAKQFASKMVADHTAVDQQAMTLAQSKGITADATPLQMQTDMLGTLNSAKPAAFDRDYLRGQVVAAQTFLKAFQDEAANGEDADIKAFASSTLPALQQHLVLARRLAR